MIDFVSKKGFICDMDTVSEANKLNIKDFHVFPETVTSDAG